MAKGRKQHGSTDRHDRLLGTYGYGNGLVPSTDQPELGEDDVWLTSYTGQAVPNGSWTGPEPGHVNSDTLNHTPYWSNDDSHRHVGGLSLAFDNRYGAGPTAIHQYRNVDSPSHVIHQYRNVDGPNHRHVAGASAPMNVPSWSKMVRVDCDSMNGSVELDRDESEWIPPHEYLTREHGSSVTTSVFEGVGRTLKGRDMRRVRDAVWSKTGFFG